MLTNPITAGPLTERLFKSFHYAELLKRRTVINPIRLRIIRILLYWYYEQLCISAHINSSMLNRRSRERNIASIVIEKLLENIYHSDKSQTDPQT